MENKITLDDVLAIGFEHAAFFDPANLEFRQEVREMCAAGKCHMYDKCWSCPPACGTVEESVEALQINMDYIKIKKQMNGKQVQQKL